MRLSQNNLFSDNWPITGSLITGPCPPITRYVVKIDHFENIVSKIGGTLSDVATDENIQSIISKSLENIPENENTRGTYL